MSTYLSQMGFVSSDFLRRSLHDQHPVELRSLAAITLDNDV